jgi:hypothetical protein
MLCVSGRVCVRVHPMPSPCPSLPARTVCRPFTRLGCRGSHGSGPGLFLCFQSIPTWIAHLDAQSHIMQLWGVGCWIRCVVVICCVVAGSKQAGASAGSWGLFELA